MRPRASTEVAKALAAGTPVVALESSVIAQGLPAPFGLEAARRCEAAVRAEGATPATIAVLEGEIRVGLRDEELARLADRTAKMSKLSTGALAIELARGGSGGTTVSATCEIAAAAGIRVFATGGIGGVHRGVVEHFDLSSDLMALARFPVAVVCTGAKAVLDLPKTLELLETLGVPVIGVGTAEFPAFYAGSSGLALEHRVDVPAELGAILRARFELLGQGGVLLVQPSPKVPVAADVLERAIDAAVAKADRQGVRGKAVTPFLLAELARVEGAGLIDANIALLENNARLAAQVARAYADAPKGGGREPRSRRRKPRQAR